MRDYIARLIDRNLQRRRESGLTFYALISVLLIILYKILLVSPSIPIKSEYWIILFVFTCVANIFVSLGLMYEATEDIIKHSAPIRLILNTNNLGRLLPSLIKLLTFIFFPILLNGLTFYYLTCIKNKFGLFFLIITIFYGLFLLKWVKYRTIFDKKNKIKILEGTGRRDADGYIFGFSFFWGIFVIIGSIWYLFFLETELPIHKIILFTVLFYSIPIVIIFILNIRKSDDLIKSLEEIEYEIYVKNLSDKEIHEKLQAIYFGFGLSEWLIYRENSINEFIKNIEKLTMAIKSKKSNTKTTNENPDLTKQPIVDNLIEEEASKLINVINKYYENVLIDFDNILETQKLQLIDKRSIKIFRSNVVEKFRKLLIDTNAAFDFRT